MSFDCEEYVLAAGSKLVLPLYIRRPPLLPSSISLSRPGPELHIECILCMFRLFSNKRVAASVLGRYSFASNLRTDRIILHHAERPMRAGSYESAIVASHGHADEPDGNGP